ncbi:MAG: glutamyl-tRNA reductase [Candidatus Omnitrophica bacterium]|nr:glutamyl-tRNA reductase [Candidatus Omnitrophota bacterium]
MAIVVVGLSHHTAPVALREKFAFPEGAIPQALNLMRQSGLAEEGVILSTCNRVEMYLATAAAAADKQSLDAIRKFLQDSRGYSGALSNEFYALSEPHSIEHLFRVACGLDSMVLGETEILGQLKQAYHLALQHKHTGSRLNKVFQRAFNVAKQIRTETQIQRGSISVASVAVELAEKIFSTLGHRHVMVLGAGDTSAKTARALLSRGANSVLVSNRTYENAVALANELGGRAVPFEAWASEFTRIDIVISSTSAPHFILDRARLEPLMKLRKNEPLLLIDIAVPRDIEPEVNFLDNVYLYNIDDLQTIANDYLRQRQEQVAHCENIIREKVHGILAGLGRANPPPLPDASLRLPPSMTIDANEPSVNPPATPAARSSDNAPPLKQPKPIVPPEPPWNAGYQQPTA